jgi:shikimate kinase
MNYLIAGMKHCGKTTHGKALAKHFRCSFYDTDDLIEREYLERTGEKLTCREFFKQFGAEAFKEIEADVFRKLYEKLRRNNSSHVISLGGRLACNPDLEEELKNFGLFIYIKTEPKLLFKRVMDRGRPPFLSAENPYDDFLRIYEEREPYFEKYAGLVIELTDEPLYKIRREFIDKVERYIDGR